MKKYLKKYSQLLKKVSDAAKQPRVRIVAAAVLLIAVVGVLLQVGPKAPGGTDMSAQAYKDQLQKQVDTETGAPRSGRDPATQGQSSLSSAASKPTGAGARTDTPAAGTTGGHDHHDSHTHSSATQTGINSAGCYTDYGIQGQECLPAHAAGADSKLSCNEVRAHFPHGIKVSGTDRFHLDHNGDKLACGHGE